MINNTIVNLEKEIITTINKANLPISIVSLILNKISMEVKYGLENALEQELEENEKETSEAE